LSIYDFIFDEMRFFEKDLNFFLDFIFDFLTLFFLVSVSHSSSLNLACGGEKGEISIFKIPPTYHTYSLDNDEETHKEDVIEFELLGEIPFHQQVFYFFLQYFLFYQLYLFV